MRLTVHLEEAKQQTIEYIDKKTKEPKTKKITMNTLSFSDVQESDLNVILRDIESQGDGKPTKYYFSEDKRIGRVKKKKK